MDHALLTVEEKQKPQERSLVCLLAGLYTTGNSLPNSTYGGRFQKSKITEKHLGKGDVKREVL
jgi:hypothetical protein